MLEYVSLYCIPFFNGSTLPVDVYPGLEEAIFQEPLWVAAPF